MNKLILILFFIGLGCNGKAQQSFPVEKHEDQWKAELTSAEYHVLRKAGTEPAFTSDLLQISEPGTFVCAACGNPLYKTENKFDSGTGWPSFDRAYKDENLFYRKDPSLGVSAVEVLCANCGGHLGHIFNDGPKETTGKRHCINGVAMDFIPTDEKK